MTHPISQVRHVSRVQSPNQFEFDVVGAERAEQRSASAEQDRDEMDLHLVEQPCPRSVDVVLVGSTDVRDGGLMSSQGAAADLPGLGCSSRRAATAAAARLFDADHHRVRTD